MERIYSGPGADFPIQPKPIDRAEPDPKKLMYFEERTSYLGIALSAIVVLMGVIILVKLFVG